MTDANSQEGAEQVSSLDQDDASRPDGLDKRRHARVHCGYPIRIVTPRGMRVTGRMRDLSESGLAFTFEASAAAGLRLDVTFSVLLPGGSRTVKAETRVVYSRLSSDKYLIGVEFSSITSDNLETIKAYVDYRQKPRNTTL